jgi:hypothetical protein
MTRVAAWLRCRDENGPPPRSLAAEANDCFVVLDRTPIRPDTRMRRDASRPIGGPASVRLRSAYPLTASASTDGNNLNLEGKKIALNKVT